MPMIPLGLKETKELALADCFLPLIESHYYEEGAEYEEALAELADLRQAMRTPTRWGLLLLFPLLLLLLLLLLSDWTYH